LTGMATNFSMLSCCSLPVIETVSGGKALRSG